MLMKGKKKEKYITIILNFSLKAAFNTAFNFLKLPLLSLFLRGLFPLTFNLSNGWHLTLARNKP